MNSDSPDKDYEEPAHEDNSVDNLVKNISPKFRAGNNCDLTNIGHVLAAISIEYIQYVQRLETLNSAETARVEEIERFHQLLDEALSEQEFASVQAERFCRKVFLGMSNAEIAKFMQPSLRIV